MSNRDALVVLLVLLAGCLTIEDTAHAAAEPSEYDMECSTMPRRTMSNLSAPVPSMQRCCNDEGVCYLAASANGVAIDCHQRSLPAASLDLE